MEVIFLKKSISLKSAVGNLTGNDKVSKIHGPPRFREFADLIRR